VKLGGSRVLITGGGTGIGRALADSFARRGARLAVVGRRPDPLRRAAEELAASFPDIPRTLTQTVDVVEPTQVRTAVERCVAAYGGIDILVNNAGICVYGAVERTGPADFRTMLETNLLGALNCTMAVLPMMKRQGSGLFVNIASVAALHGIPYLSAYSASKAALVSLSQSLRAELHQTGISVMLVYPGYTESDIFRSERHVGGAHRPTGPYAPAATVAETIIRAIEAERRDLVLTREGRALRLARDLAPGLVEKATARVAARLRDQGG
jgi:NAD(P)-dependent dehydrogenase (short-subunit alcohol dehydrogenase family)